MDFEDYNPRAETKKILDRAWQLVNSVPYRVSARWVFYRLLQEGFYSSKDDYKNKWLKACSLARKNFYNGWHPATLSDETREPIIRGRGVDSVSDWLLEMSKQAVCNLDKWTGQPVYLELWYEARAMSDQFRHYTKHITLRPMGGEPSIPYKWQAAKALEQMSKTYDVPIVVLYFGDLDYHGEIISDVIEREVGEWCSCYFEFVRCGLDEDQVYQYNVPENPEKPGQYQWEALSDEGAREIITESVGQYLRHDAFTEVEQKERDATAKIRAELTRLAKEMGDNNDQST